MAGEVKKKENNQYIRRERTVCTAGRYDAFIWQGGVECSAIFASIAIPHS